MKSSVKRNDNEIHLTSSTAPKQIESNQRKTRASGQLRPSAQPRLRWFSGLLPALVSVVIVAVTGSSCAWNYAGRQVSDPPDPKEQTIVVAHDGTQVEQDPSPTEGSNPVQNDQSGDAGPNESTQTRPPRDPCLVSVFTVSYFGEDSQVSKVLSCPDGKTVSVNRTPMGESTQQSATARNLPARTWYIMVDPTGPGGTVINNRQFLDLARHFGFEFHGKDPETGHTIYRFAEEVP